MDGHSSGSPSCPFKNVHSALCSSKSPYLFPLLILFCCCVVLVCCWLTGNILRKCSQQYCPLQSIHSRNSNLLDSPLGQNPFFILQNDHLLCEFCSQTKLNKRNCWNFGKKMFDGRSNVANGKEKENGHRMNGGTIGIERKMDSNVFDENARGEHPNSCLFGTLHLVGAMRLLVAIGLCAFLALCVLEAIHFRRALFVMAIPGFVILLSALAILRNNPRLLWPIIGISFFHLFLDAYVILIFLFFFFFKPLYIIMVLNWAFDTLHTSKTPSYYAHCAAIFTFLSMFAAFNFWQLRISLRFQTYLEELLAARSSATSSISAGTNPSSNGTNDGGIIDNGFGPNSQKQKCKILNEPPIVLSERRTSNVNKTLLLCPSPALSQRGGSHQIRTTMGGIGGGLGPRRPSFGDQRQFGTR